MTRPAYAQAALDALRGNVNGLPPQQVQAHADALCAYVAYLEQKTSRTIPESGIGFACNTCGMRMACAEPTPELRQVLLEYNSTPTDARRHGDKPK